MGALQDGVTDNEYAIKEYINAVKEKQNKDIYIYGAGNVAKNIYVLCRDHGIDIRGFLVTDISANVYELYGLAVNQFDSVKLNPDKTLILIGVIENGIKTITNMLEANGWKNFINLPGEMCTHVSYMNDERSTPMMEITTVIGCSVNCRYCPQNNLLHSYYKENKERIRVMKLEDYKTCIDKLPSNVRIRFAGFAEPFLNEDCIEMLEYAQQQRREIDLYTTLVGLTMEGFDRIKNIKFRRVVLHTPDVDGHAVIPVTKEYLQMLQKIVDDRRPDGTLFVDWANCQSSPHPEVLKILGGHLKINVELYDRAGNVESNDELKHVDFVSGFIECVMSKDMNRTILLPDGTVVLCCNDYGLQHPLGNLLLESYDDIMNGSEMRRVKEACYDDKMPLLCRKCIWAKRISSKNRV